VIRTLYSATIRCIKATVAISSLGKLKGTARDALLTTDDQRPTAISCTPPRDEFEDAADQVPVVSSDLRL
jgi:hypothetical protein